MAADDETDYTSGFHDPEDTLRPIPPWALQELTLANAGCGVHSHFKYHLRRLLRVAGSYTCYVKHDGHYPFMVLSEVQVEIFVERQLPEGPPETDDDVARPYVQDLTLAAARVFRHYRRHRGNLPKP